MGLITKEVEITLNGKTTKWYEEKGYKIPRRKDKWGDYTTPQGTKIKVSIEDLQNNSFVKVEVECDNCGEKSFITWSDYNKYKHENKYYCKPCGVKVIGREKIMKTQLSKSISLKQWCINNNKENILELWDYKLNNLKPDEICYSSRLKFYFRCPEGKHESELKNIHSFTGGNNISCIQCKMIYNTHPYLEKYFVNKEDMKKYSIHSNKRVLLKCPDCGYEKEMKMNDFANKSFSCPRCGDGISYPEKFVLNILEQLNIDFIPQLSKTTFEWCKNYKYDFYIPKLNVIIEVHGLPHYDKGWESIGGRTLQQEQENDQIKKELALGNGIKEENYIVVDCRESNLDWIKNSIIQSNLSTLLNFKKDDINWFLCHENACKSLVKKACELWNSGMRNTQEIADKLKVYRTTVLNYLNQGEILGFCITDLRRVKKVICLNTYEIFNNQVEASNYFNTYPQYIGRSCRNKQKYAGKHPITNEKLKWMYYEDYLTMQQNNQI